MSLDKGKGGKGAKAASPILDGPTESDTSRPLDSEEIQALAIRFEELEKVKMMIIIFHIINLPLVTFGKTINSRRTSTKVFYRQENQNWSAKTTVSLRRIVYHF